MLFFLTTVLFLCSLQLFFSARTAWSLIIAILLGEWGHFAALVAFILATLGWGCGRLGKITALLAIITAAICLWPVISAVKIATSLPSRCNAAFGSPRGNGELREPFSVIELFRIIRSDDVVVTEHTYANNDAKPLTLDLYQTPERYFPRPLIVMVHGGSWNRSSKKELTAINRHLATEGYNVAAINYRHAPKFPFPAAVEDVFRAIEFLQARAVELQIDPSRVVLVGRSAGGQIALSAAYARRVPAIRGVVAFYPPTDLALGYQNPSARWVLDSKEVLEQYLGGTPAEKPAEYRNASPVNFVDDATPPTLLIHGALDSVVWSVHSELLAERLAAAARPHLLLALPWATHGCDANLSGPSGQLSLYAIDRFLASVFAR